MYELHQSHHQNKKLIGDKKKKKITSYRQNLQNTLIKNKIWIYYNKIQDVGYLHLNANNNRRQIFFPI